MHGSIFLLTGSDLPANDNGKQVQPERSELSSQFQWRLEDIYPDDQSWEDDFGRARDLVPMLAALVGKIGESADNLLLILQKLDQIHELLGKLVVYANMRWHEDMRNHHYQGASARVSTLGVEFQAAAAFIEPEIIAIPEDTLASFYTEQKNLALYRHHLQNLRRRKSHILSKEEEQLLALADDALDQPQNIFNMYNNADLKFPTTQDAAGREIELTKALYLKLLEENNRAVRVRAFKAFWPEYERVKNTLATTIAAQVKRDVFYARARKYPNCLEAALDVNHIPIQVYDNLIATINANLAPLHRYLALRKQALKLDDLHPYDLYCPLVPEVKWEVPYEEAKTIVQAALAPLGPVYLEKLAQSFDSGWIDVYENKGKRSGAYSWGSYSTHPYILMNYMDKLRDLFTLAHELGHSMHSFFTHKHQPIVYGSYSIFLAEIASITNEAFLLDYLIKQESDPARKIYLVSHHIQEIFATVYTQTLYAQFEKQIHDSVENGQPLTVATLNCAYRDLCAHYYGPELAIDPEFELNWARIPHFYYNFYVYQYATGYSAATAIASGILAGDLALRDRYLQFLQSGSSDYSINILSQTGVDMTTAKPFEAVVTIFNRLVDELAGLLK